VYPQIAPRIFYNPETPYGNFHVRITLPEDYYEIVFQLDKTRIDEIVQRNSRNLSAFSEGKKSRKQARILHRWDEKRGLYMVEIQEPPFAPSMFLAERDREYQTHNITTIPHVLTLSMIGLDYLDYVNCFSRKTQPKND